MEELSSEKNKTFKIEAFDLKNDNDLISNAGNNNNDMAIHNFKSRSVNILSEEEKVKNNNNEINNKSNSLMSQQIKIKPSQSFSSYSKEDKISKSSNRKLPIFDEMFANEYDDNIDSIDNNSIEKEHIKEMNKNCLLCEEKLKDEEINNNFIGCFHGFCDSCYYDYLKEKIINNNIENIKCLQYGCNVILFDDFIQRHIINDMDLVEKYLKFKERKQITKDPNAQFCPYPNCESYALKKSDNNYVTCFKGHNFCFNCLQNWHGTDKCKVEKDSKFDKWKNSKNVKRCPNCQYFVEKNEGCNHMICANCKYEWCWFCLKESLPGHYDEGGNCYGLQYSKCQCFSYRICAFLYQLLLQILGILKFIIISPIIFYIFIFERIKELYYDVYSFFTALITFFYCLVMFIYSLYIIFSLSLIMLFYWPFKRKIKEYIDDFW